MALSLVCEQCGLQLRSVKECQEHNTVSGHTQFAESKEAIKLMVCEDCGKPCRTDAERGMHTRFTGHTKYIEKTTEEVVDTDRQMKAAQAEAKAEAMEVDGVAAGKAGSAGGAAAPGAGAEGGSAAAGTSGSGEEMVPPEVDSALLKEMTESMGFSKARAVRALHFSGNSSVEAAVNWLMDHDGDADIDEPLLITKAEANKPKLTPEEARKKAEELMRRAKEKREREEKEAERKRELERIRAGKELLLAKEQAKEAEMKRIAEQRKREKEEDMRAREALRKQLEEDRKERRRKLGLPGELTEEEKAREAEKEAEKQREEERKKAASAVPVKPISVIDKLRGRLVDMKKSAVAVDGAKEGEERFKTAITLLSKYVANVARSPDEEKFRTIKLTNATFQQKVSCVPGAVEFLELCGFKRDPAGELLALAREAVSLDVLTAAGAEIHNALTNPFFGAL